MRRTGTILSCALLVVALAMPVAAGNPHQKCTTIQDGILVNSAGETLYVGFDEWGYNYQAKLFNGFYCDAYRDAAWCQDYAEDKLQMKWNDAWLSNMDCDDDGLLDRHFGYDSYIGSGAWLTNHMSGEYVGADDEICSWNYFVKIVAAPSSAELVDGMWYLANGDELGPVIWGDFATILEVSNDSCAGEHGVLYVSPVGPGLGKF